MLILRCIVSCLKTNTRTREMKALLLLYLPDRIHMLVLCFRLLHQISIQIGQEIYILPRINYTTFLQHNVDENLMPVWRQSPLYLSISRMGQEMQVLFQILSSPSGTKHWEWNITHVPLQLPTHQIAILEPRQSQASIPDPLVHFQLEVLYFLH